MRAELKKDVVSHNFAPIILHTALLRKLGKQPEPELKMFPTVKKNESI